MERPKVDDRVKTEDVTGTEGLTFRDFELDDAVQFVSELTQSIGLLSINLNQSLNMIYPLRETNG